MLDWAETAWRSRWMMLVAGLWIQCTAGSSYVFSLYSEGLKRGLGYDQQKLDLIGFSKDLGANVGIHTGLLFLVIPPWAVLVLGTINNTLGYLIMWLAATKRISHIEFWEMCVSMFCAANAQTYINTAVVVTAVENFPVSRGTVIGLMKGLLGLSGAILTLIYGTIFGNQQVTYLLFASIVTTVVTLLLMFFIRRMAVIDDPFEMSDLKKLSAIALGLAIGIMCYTIIKSTFKLPETVKISVCILVLIIVISPIFVVFKAERRRNLQEKQPLLSDDGCSSSAAASEVKIEVTELKRGDDYSLQQAFTSVDFWLLFLATACSMGSGLTAINNLNQVGRSLGYSQHDIAMLVSLISIWNFLGRCGGGFVSDIFLHYRGIPRPAFISLTLGLMAVGHLVLAAAFPGAVYVGTVIVGICYGSQWSLMPATASEIFGLKHFGTLFNSIAVASPLGSYLMSVRLAGYLYDREASKQHPQQQQTFSSCQGPSCFRLTFIIMAAVCVLGCISTIALVIRTTSYYHSKQRWPRVR